MTVEVHPLADVEPGAAIGAGSRIWRFCHVMAGARIGRDCSFGQGCFVAEGAVVGDRVRVQNHVSVYAGVVLEDDVFVGPSAVFTNVRNPRAAHPTRDYEQTVVHQAATIGANATILPGVSVGRWAFVGAGAVITNDVPEHALVVGVPARQVGWVSERGARLDFDADGGAKCPLGGESYVLRDGICGRSAPRL